MLGRRAAGACGDSWKAQSLNPFFLRLHTGASLVQIYTAMAYDGPKAVPEIKRQLAACLERDGFKSVAEAVGADHRKGAKKK